MKKLTFLTAILAIILSGCSKFETVDTNETSTNQIVSTTTQGQDTLRMSDLSVSENFDWKLTKTIEVNVTLPEDDASRLLYIYSQDGKQLYFKGHPEDASNVLKTKITIPTYESVLLLKYGTGDEYDFIGADLNGKSLVSNLRSSLKSGRHGSEDDGVCTGCEAKLDELYLKYNGSGSVSIIVYNEKGSKAGPGDDELFNGTVTSGETFMFNNANLGMRHGKQEDLNSEITIFVNGIKNTSIHISCSQPIYVGMVSGLFEITAGTDKNGKALEACDSPNPAPPEFDCLTLWALDDNNPGNLYYVNLTDNVVHDEGDIAGFDTEDMESLAIDEDGDFYFINVAGDDKLYKILFSEVDQNPSTAVNATLIGSTNSPKITNLTFIGDDLYGIGQTSKKVYQISLTTGNATEVGDLNVSGTFTVDGLTEGLDGTIYLIKTVNSGPSELWKFNSFPNGGITKVMDIAGSGKVESLAAHPNGFLYAGDDDYIFKMDPIAETTEIQINYESDIEGLDFYWVKELDCTTPPPPPSDPCDDDGNYNIRNFGWFKFEYKGVVEFQNGNSMWTYEISGIAPGSDIYYQDLTHWALALCEGVHNVVGADPYDSFEVVGDDDDLNFYGIKFNKTIDVENGTMTFSFMLDDQYKVEPVTVGFKAGDDLYYCQIFGPSCETDSEPVLDPSLDGTLAFEDLWPGKGDFDLNDLVLEYGFDVTKDNNENVEHITATFKIKAFGAEYKNGFGFELAGVDPSDIVSVTGYDIESTWAYDIASNGVENGQSNAVFIAYDNAFRIMEHPGMGTGVNTVEWATYVNPVTITLEIEFVEDAVTYSELNIGEFNPFIVVDQNRAKEVHLPNYKPTDLAGEWDFGTYDDDSDPDNDRYYKSHDNLLWAINIPATFKYPKEKQAIVWSYNNFADWAQSDGVDYPDWYMDKPGYRNAWTLY